LSLAKKAVRGAAWTIGTSMGARLVGVIGTLAITRFLAPDVIGEVAVASVLVLTANQLSIFGFGHYLIAKPRSGRAAAFHCSFYHLCFGVVALGVVLLAREPLTPLFGSPHAVIYVPGLVLAVFLDRLSYMPERVMVRDMRFSTVGLGRTLAELSYTGVSVGLAAYGWGGEAIVLANIVRSAMRLVVFGLKAPWREWIEPHRITSAQTRDLFRFGLPISIATTANFASRKWDNLLFASIFGPGPMGTYNLAYNLADIPASQIGEHIGDVLLPSFAHMEERPRKRALVRSTALLALIVFPLAVGLGAVSETLVAALFNREWQGVAPLLLVLSALAVFRPIGWTIASYLQVRDLTRQIMYLEVFKVAALLSGLGVLGYFWGPTWACAGVGLGFGLHAIASCWMVQLADDIKMTRMLGGFVGPLLACAPMVGAVYGVRYGLHAAEIGNVYLYLGLELAAGAVAYVLAAFVFARPTALDFVALLRKSFGRAPRPTEG
jgi:PST family polysaccharide transporter